ncbi:MAG TPA: hypothetical protein VFX65_04840 [Candidatus Limnocylindrales bacterium]|nr:hypothetical protein [Candidatus Limnocylindrales bacterium]
MSVGRMPDVSVYRDGTVLRRTDDGGDVMRLTSDGLAQVEAVADDSGLLRASTDIGPDPNHAAGFTTYSITFAANGVTVRRSVANAFPEAFRAEAQRFIALADRLATLDRWLPASAWLIGPAGAEPWIPDRYVLKVIDWGYVPDLVPPVDFADVVWPLDEGPLEVGDPADMSDLGAAAARCAVLPLDDARWIEVALSAAFRDQRIPAAYLQADLAWAERGSFLSIGLHVLLPDDADDCSLDPSWP